jgi:hypothetical protein
VAEINGLLNRRTTLKLYRGFESLPHRSTIKCSFKEHFYFRKYLNKNIGIHNLKIVLSRQIESLAPYNVSKEKCRENICLAVSLADINLLLAVFRTYNKFQSIVHSHMNKDHCI